MNVYLFATVLGLLGLVLMAVLGGLHGTANGHGHASHTGGHSGPGSHSSGSPNHGHSVLRDLHHGAGHGHGPSSGGGGAALLMSLASPRVLLSVVLGFGLTGMLLERLVPGALLLILAALGGILFEWLLIRPYWDFLLRFESRPALSLASASGSPARAATDFGTRGTGLITFELNGETRQMLAQLGDRALNSASALNSSGSDTAVPPPVSVPVRQGDALTIETIDESSNRCTVRRS